MCKIFKATIARLESQVDFLESELTNLHDLLVRCGFSEGIKTLKESAQELLESEVS
jgi:hypothetical protein